uniref:DEP domain-containing protein n=1 Tax=Globisporangium ultimum (strain ATCC 200006 / CBS 805.95 / DAOM BR144) TaxID=431595 RepID=K3WG84_GLOUD
MAHAHPSGPPRPGSGERDTTILGEPFLGGAAPPGLRLEPIKPPHHQSSHSALQHQMSGLLDSTPLTRSRRASQDEIRALLQRTTMALDKIVRIRESMEEFVDFKQFEKPKRASASRLSHEQRQHQLARMSSEPVLLDHVRTTPASSYGSTAALSTSGSEDPLRSTNSTSSLDEEDDQSHTDSSSSNGSLPLTQQAFQEETQEQVDAEDDDDDDRESGNDTFDDDDACSDSSMSTTSVSPFKEARLERLKNIEISFHEGLPKEFFQALARFLFSVIEIKTRHSRFNFYKDAFTGSDAIKEMLTNGFAEDQPTAQRYGNVLVRLGYIEHVSRTDDQLHSSKDNFYRFTKALDYDDGDFLSDSAGSGNSRMSITATNYRESVLSRESTGNVDYDFTTASDEVHALVTEEVLHIFAKVLLKVFERKNKLLFYKGFVGCFLGAEAVNVIRELRIASTLIDAVLIGQCLLDEGVVEPIATTISTFQDKYIFYRLTKIRP